MEMSTAPHQPMAQMRSSELSSVVSNAHANVRQPSLPASDEEMWRQVLARDGHASFLYAVRTTGIFCRPGCPSRRPAKTNVTYFPDSPSARAAGYRACLRCRPDRQPAETAMVERLVAYLEKQPDRNIPLIELARVAGCSPHTVQKIFTKVMGLSPRAWANASRAENYRQLLANPAASITEAIYAAGFSSPSRAHHATSLGMQARRYRAQGSGERIGYALADVPLPSLAGVKAGEHSRMLVAATERGVCAVFLEDEDGALVAELGRRFPRAELAPDPALEPYVAAVLDALNEHPSAQSLPLDLRGTAFQARVWAGLQAIPRGATCTYAQLAEAIGSPKAVRAVGAACGQNPASIVVPCHRVVGSTGKLTGYRWGVERKRALLALEAAASLKRTAASFREAEHDLQPQGD